MYAAIEAGGTKFLCAYGPSPKELEFSARIGTTRPEETLAAVVEFFAGRKLRRAGIACFGPLDLAHGRIAKLTPKLAWRNYPIVAELEKRLGTAVELDTDVNAAALAESRWGAGQGHANLTYITVGTGIGGGLVVNGRLVHGLLHPELGHLRVRRVQGDQFPGCCPVHGDCLEGLACGPAIAERWRNPRAEHLPASHEAWALEARYLGQLVVNLTCTVSPECVIFGGGIGLRPGMVAAIRAAAREEMNGYVPLPKIVRAKLGARAGVYGALGLAAGDDSLAGGR
jgi:fructokinase